MPCYDSYGGLHEVNGAPLTLSGPFFSFASTGPAGFPRPYCQVGEELFFFKVDGLRRSFLPLL